MLCSSVPTAALHPDLRVNSFAVQFRQLHSDLRVDSFAVQFRQLNSDLGVDSFAVQFQQLHSDLGVDSCRWARRVYLSCLLQAALRDRQLRRLPLSAK